MPKRRPNVIAGYFLANGFDRDYWLGQWKSLDADEKEEIRSEYGCLDDGCWRDCRTCKFA